MRLNMTLYTTGDCHWVEVHVVKQEENKKIDIIFLSTARSCKGGKMKGEKKTHWCILPLTLVFFFFPLSLSFIPPSCITLVTPQPQQPAWTLNWWFDYRYGIFVFVSSFFPPSFFFSFFFFFVRFVWVCFYLAWGWLVMKEIVSEQVKIFSASASGISMANSSSIAIRTSTWSRLSRPRSLT